MRSILVAAGLAAIFMACSSSDGGSTQDPQDVGVDAVPDIDEGDTLVSVDTEQDSVDDTAPDTPEGAAVGEACADGPDCLSGLCVDVVPGDDLDGLCSAVCSSDDECPAGFDCVLLVGSGADARSVCLPVDLCIDEDGDGFGVGPGCTGADCDDTRDDISPAADEVCDGLDNDCDEQVDDNPVGVNDDCDTGFLGACAPGRTACEAGIMVCASVVEPSEELCNNVDDDCDGATDEDAGGDPLAHSCYEGDPDLIGIGACAEGVQTCVAGEYSGCVGQVLPGAEVCDEIDNDCDGGVDEGATAIEWFPDADGDGFGDLSGEPITSCARPGDYVENATDCDDLDPSAFPGASERPGDGVDSNCDGTELCHTDEDGDGYRSDDLILSDDGDCDDPGEGRVTMPGGDCDDEEASVYPGADEITGDGLDNNCDGVEFCYADEDDDAYRTDEIAISLDFDCTDAGEGELSDPDGDCDDALSAVNPGATELCDDIDNDCDLRIDEGAFCYAIGEPCEDPSDCVTGLCEDGLCAEDVACVGCPSRVGTASLAAERSSPNYTLNFTLGSPGVTHNLSSPNYTLQLGLSNYTANP